MIVFGLTGGIGSGKSSVARRLRQRGVPLIDADELARAVVEPGSPALARIFATFGAELARADGTLDRARLGARVFGNESERRALNAIVHPAVRAAARERFAEIGRNGAALSGYEVPLLYEVGLDHELSPVIVVTAPLAARLERIQLRDGLSEAEARARVEAQMPLEEKARRADYVIDNAADERALTAATDRAFDALCAELRLDPQSYPK